MFQLLLNVDEISGTALPSINWLPTPTIKPIRKILNELSSIAVFFTSSSTQCCQPASQDSNCTQTHFFTLSSQSTDTCGEPKIRHSSPICLAVSYSLSHKSFYKSSPCIPHTTWSKIFHHNEKIRPMTHKTAIYMEHIFTEKQKSTYLAHSMCNMVNPYPHNARRTLVY